jgi:hypothetical protein
VPYYQRSPLAKERGSTDIGQFHLLLHGYFFLDSGRRHIESLDARAKR